MRLRARRERSNLSAQRPVVDGGQRLESGGQADRATITWVPLMLSCEWVCATFWQPLTAPARCKASATSVDLSPRSDAPPETEA
ncbi:hypothetical protein EGN72_00335 [Pseudorhodobacter sp. E13]|nr:hypothetical protein EGN72_00335 [Pseudorhodobacter sp. E13]